MERENNKGKKQKFPKKKPSFKKEKTGKEDLKKQNSDWDEPLRLNKFISNAGICSRRDADELIKSGEISVNGEIVRELGIKVSPKDDIRYKDKKVNREQKVYILLNKPKDFVTTARDKHAEKTVIDIVKNACPERIYPVGRLDKNTTGVLLLTNDGELTKQLTHPSYNKKKIYHVQLDKDLIKGDMLKIIEGLQLDDDFIQADAISYVDEEDKTQVGIEIHSGQNRIVRRIFESLGYKIKKLDRVYFAGLTKKNLPRGKWRFLTPQEISILKRKSFK
ncbi:MAG: rRNA pseudouridine synthase [Bacteroidales bacterium]|nr:rRNA pseudouridine synthase [Bacteroidales bacterium]